MGISVPTIESQIYSKATPNVMSNIKSTSHLVAFANGKVSGNNSNQVIDRIKIRIELGESSLFEKPILKRNCNRTP